MTRMTAWTRYVILAVIAATFTLAVAKAQAGEGAPTGLYRTPVDDGVVELFRCRAALCGRILDSGRLRAHPDQTDLKNPDPRLRSRALRGLVFLELRATGAGWTGRIYNPKDGATYEARLTPRPDGSVAVAGCVLRLLCLSQTWRPDPAGVRVQ